MSRKKRRPRQFVLDAKALIVADTELAARHATLTGEGYALGAKARCCRCRDNSLTVQLCWTKRRHGGSTTETVTIRGL